MENIETVLLNIFSSTRLSDLFSGLKKSEYTILILLLDLTFVKKSTKYEISLDFIKNNLNKKTDTRTIKRALKSLQKKYLIIYKESKNYISYKTYTKERNQIYQNIKFLSNFKRYLEVLNKNYSNNLNIKTEILQKKIINQFYKFDIRNQKLMYLVAEETLDSLTYDSEMQFLESKIESLSVQYDLLEELKYEYSRGKYFKISFPEESIQLFYKFLKNKSTFKKVTIRKITLKKVTFNKELMNEVTFAFPNFFVFKDLPLNQMLVLLFLLEFWEYSGKFVYPFKEKKKQDKFLQYIFDIDKNLIAKQLNYDISNVNRILHRLDKSKYIILINHTQDNYSEITINMEKIDGIYEKKFKELQKLNGKI
ncbi:MAG: hypothetical protein RO257_14515 [Candidatus Kapabacteria bacterium]|nr:hypothetical protein [Candidatus Kapabacteria bacterium]